MTQKPPPTPSNQQVLITKNKTTTTKPTVQARTKDLRLNGSDLYVARLGNCHTSPPKLLTPPSSPPPPSPKSAPSSLHDELSPLSRTPPLTLPPQPKQSTPEIRASRPCYRCVTAMHAAGIKRVFWTTQEGRWEGAKVRDLVEALEGGEGKAEGDAGGKGVFVTKHEVLLIKRLMGF